MSISEIIAERLAQLEWDTTPPAWRFPGGLRYCYFRSNAGGRKREWECCWSTVRNENGKFTSWAYVWRGDRAEAVKFMEHTKRKAAKARALRMHRSRIG